MLNRMSIEKIATMILKRAVAAEYIPEGSPAAARNIEIIHEDFTELADRLGYRVEKKSGQGKTEGPGIGNWLNGTEQMEQQK